MIFWLYLVDFLAKCSVFCSIGILLSCVVLIISLVGMAIEREDRPWNFVKNKLWILCVMVLALIVIPSEKTMYLMLSSKMMGEVMDNDKVSGIGQKSLKLLEQKLDEILEKK